MKLKEACENVTFVAPDVVFRGVNDFMREHRCNGVAASSASSSASSGGSNSGSKRSSSIRDVNIMGNVDSDMIVCGVSNCNYECNDNKRMKRHWINIHE